MLGCVDAPNQRNATSGNEFLAAVISGRSWPLGPRKRPFKMHRLVSGDSPTVVPGEGAAPCEQGTHARVLEMLFQYRRLRRNPDVGAPPPLPLSHTHSLSRSLFSSVSLPLSIRERRTSKRRLKCAPEHLQGYLAHKKPPTPLGPP